MAISAKEMQINEAIRAKEVRLVGMENEQLGIVSLNEALDKAFEKGVDLVLIAPQAVPPVCRIMDYGKFRYENEKRDKEARKKQQTVEVKEVQLSYKIDTHDFNTKVNHAHRFLSSGDKVKVVVRFKGREMAHIELGRKILLEFEEACKDLGTVEKRPVLDGRLLSMMISPNKNSSNKQQT